MNRLNIFLTLVLSASVFLSFSTSPEVETEQVQVVNESLEVQNRTVVKEQPRPNVSVTDPYHHIQNADHDTEVSMTAGNLNIDGVDSVMDTYGSSMAPTVMQDDKLLIQNYNNEKDLETGQIISFESGNGQTFHRIVGDYEERGYVLTRGDNNDYSEKVNLENVSYIVKGVVYG